MDRLWRWTRTAAKRSPSTRPAASNDATADNNNNNNNNNNNHNHNHNNNADKEKEGAPQGDSNCNNAHSDDPKPHAAGLSSKKSPNGAKGAGSGGGPSPPKQPRLETLTQIGEDWLYLALLGTIMAMLSFGMDTVITLFLNTRNWLFADAKNGNPVSQYLGWCLTPIVLVTFSSSFVHLCSPTAIGSGIPEMKTILRGVVLNEYLTFRTLIAKIVGLTFTLGSGLPLGKEGPFVHIASIVATLLSKLLASFQGVYENESRTSEMLSAACAVGVAATFYAPIGGVLFSIEVTTVYFAVRNYWRGFFAACCGATIWRLLSFWVKNDESISALFKTSFNTDYPFDPLELLVFSFIGATCGLAGASYIRFHREIVQFFRRHKRVSGFLQKHRFVYPVLVTLVITTATFPPFLGKYTASTLSTHVTIEQLFSNRTWSLGGNDLHSKTILDTWTTPHTPFQLHLVLYIVMLFWTSTLASTIPIPSGVFIPVLKMGAAYGRLIGELMHSLFPNGINYGDSDRTPITIVPGSYAVVGAAAFSGAVTHTISTSMILFEMTGQIVHIIPVILGVLIANAVCQSLQPSIYDSIIEIKKLPYLPPIASSNSVSHKILVRDFMSTNLAYVWKERCTYNDLKQLLIKHKKLISFPLVESPRTMKLLGSVARPDLLKLLYLHLGRERRLQEVCRRNSDTLRPAIHFISSISEQQQQQQELSDSPEGGAAASASDGRAGQVPSTTTTTTTTTTATRADEQTGDESQPAPAVAKVPYRPKVALGRSFTSPAPPPPPDDDPLQLRRQSAADELELVPRKLAAADLSSSSSSSSSSAAAAATAATAAAVALEPHLLPLASSADSAAQLIIRASAPVSYGAMASASQLGRRDHLAEGGGGSGSGAGAGLARHASAAASLSSSSGGEEDDVEAGLAAVKQRPAEPKPRKPSMPGEPTPVAKIVNLYDRGSSMDEEVIDRAKEEVRNQLAAVNQAPEIVVVVPMHPPPAPPPVCLSGSRALGEGGVADDRAPHPTTEEPRPSRDAANPNGDPPHAGRLTVPDAAPAPPPAADGPTQTSVWLPGATRPIRHRPLSPTLSFRTAYHLHHSSSNREAHNSSAQQQQQQQQQQPHHQTVWSTQRYSPSITPHPSPKPHKSILKPSSTSSSLSNIYKRNMSAQSFTHVLAKDGVKLSLTSADQLGLASRPSQASIDVGLTLGPLSSLPDDACQRPPRTRRKVRLPQLRVVDMTPEEQQAWEREQLTAFIDISKCQIDEAPFQLVEQTSLYRVHTLFSMLGLNHAYVTSFGRLVGIVALKDIRNAIERMLQER